MSDKPCGKTDPSTGCNFDLGRSIFAEGLSWIYPVRQRTNSLVNFNFCTKQVLSIFHGYKKLNPSVPPPIKEYLLTIMTQDPNLYEAVLTVLKTK